jgi:DNA processing protein
MASPGNHAQVPHKAILASSFTTFSRQPSLPFAENNAIPELPPEEATVFAALGDQESGVDRLIDATGLPSQVVTATLMKLEMRRLVRALPGFRYVKR